MVTVNIATAGGGSDADIELDRDPSVGLLDAVYIGATNKVFKASAGLGGNAAIGFVTDLPTGTTAKVRTEKVLSGFSGLTPTQAVFLSTTPGLITHTPPSGTGQIVQELGIALTASSILIKVDTDATVNA